MPEFSPMMQQYLELKEKYKDYVLFFRLGDFYEMFFEDARNMSKELDLTLTGRDCGGGERADMCGVPYHSCEGYIARLIEKGYKIAICEQLEDPSRAKGLVKRGVTRIITPGTVTDPVMLDEKVNNYICSVYEKDNIYGVALCDVSIGEMRLNIHDTMEGLFEEVGRVIPAEVVLSEGCASNRKLCDYLLDKVKCAFEVVADKEYFSEKVFSLLDEKFGAEAADKLKVPSMLPCAYACWALIDYLKNTQHNDVPQIGNYDMEKEDHTLELDLTAIRNLELFETMRAKNKAGTLLHVLDSTSTSMGARMLRRWLERPLADAASIVRRQNGVNELYSSVRKRDDLSEALSGVTDLERLSTKISNGTANAKDLRSAAAAMERFPRIKELLSSFESELLKSIAEKIDPLTDVCGKINASIEELPPFSLREGGLIKAGAFAEVDELRSIRDNGKSWIAKMELNERAKTGIKNLRISYNNVFGYYIEVTKSYLHLVPPEYVRKQTLVGSERYIIDELKDLENKITGANERLCLLEYQIFCEIRDFAASNARRMQETARAVAEADCIASMASVAAANKYVRPDIDVSNCIDIKDGRHPVVEKMLGDSFFVPNDVYLNSEGERVAVITGPNMAGKSTYMRQTALIVIMAQMGSFVPAKSARIGVVDKIFTRIGASDDLASGQSTFMVEMSEVAHILKNATKESLIILDEIGRGTSTFDGMSIARAVLEYIVDKRKLGAKTMFATHYHELTSLEGEISGIKNYQILVKKKAKDIVFLRKVVTGGADDSYGVEVARLAGVPESVIQRANDILAVLESQEFVKIEPAERLKAASTGEGQLSFEPEETLPEEFRHIIDSLAETDINSMTPFEAMTMLKSLSDEARLLK